MTINKLRKRSTLIGLDVMSHEIGTVGYLLATAYKLLERSGHFLAKSVQVTGKQWSLSRKKSTRYWNAVITFSQRAYKLLKRSDHFLAKRVQVTEAQ